MEGEFGTWGSAADPAAVGKGTRAPSSPSLPHLSTTVIFQITHTSLTSHPARVPSNRSISTVDIQLVTITGTPRKNPAKMLLQP